MTLNRNPVVDSFLASLDHPLKPVIERLRIAVLDADDAIFPSAEAATARQADFVELVREWIRA